MYGLKVLHTNFHQNQLPVSSSNGDILQCSSYDECAILGLNRDTRLEGLLQQNDMFSFIKDKVSSK